MNKNPSAHRSQVMEDICLVLSLDRGLHRKIFTGNHGYVAIPMTDPNGAAIYGAPWIPSIYPQ